MNRKLNLFEILTIPRETKGEVTHPEGLMGPKISNLKLQTL